MYSGEFVSFFVVSKQWFKSLSSLTDWIKNILAKSEKAEGILQFKNLNQNLFRRQC